MIPDFTVHTCLPALVLKAEARALVLKHEFSSPRVTQSVAVPTVSFPTEASDGLNARALR